MDAKKLLALYCYGRNRTQKKFELKKIRFFDSIFDILFWHSKVLQLPRPLRIFFYLLQNRKLPKKIKNTKFEKKN